MSVADAILEKLEKLSPEDQRKVLEIVESLQPHPARKNPRGMFADRAIDHQRRVDRRSSARGLGRII